MYFTILLVSLIKLTGYGMSLSIPMLIPMIVGVLIGVSCRRLYVKIRERAVDQQSKALFQMRQQRLQEHRASLRQNMRAVDAEFVDDHSEMLRG